MNRRQWLGCAAGALASCSGPTQEAPKRMGENVQTGGLVYTVIEADWVQQIQSGGMDRIPKERFVVLRVQVANASNRELNAPLLRLKDDSGAVYPEVSDLRDVPEWLGLIRTIAPGEFINGRIYFEAPTRNLLLEVVDASDSGTDKMALIAIPMRLEVGEPVQAPTGTKQ
ncbi:MAG: DUF4352 domain-containing protein [Acidobacteria bacterium]|nr:DUF4352 domain-containing protein [Acidobacteriota bacterium]